jgi:hypothetical protein
LLAGPCRRPGHRCGTASVHPGCDASVWKLRSRRGKNHGLHESQLCAALPGMSAGNPRRFWRASWGLSSSNLPSSHAPALPPLRLKIAGGAANRSAARVRGKFASSSSARGAGEFHGQRCDGKAHDTEPEPRLTTNRGWRAYAGPKVSPSMSAYGTKRTSQLPREMSAFGNKMFRSRVV